MRVVVQQVCKTLRAFPKAASSGQASETSPIPEVAQTIDELAHKMFDGQHITASTVPASPVVNHALRCNNSASHDNVRQKDISDYLAEFNNESMELTPLALASEDAMAVRNIMRPRLH